MKSNDWTVIVAIVILSSLLSFGFTSYFIGNSKTNPVKVEQVEPLDSKFPLPNKEYFNEKAINPTQDITIGDADNTNPFGSSQ